jgi:hypothetical protein
MALLKQVQFTSISKRQGVVGDCSQRPALCYLARARSLDPIDRQEATVILESLARPGASEPGAERGERERHAAVWSVKLREGHADLQVAKSVDRSVIAESILSGK